MHREDSYRKAYLQKNFGYCFEGYSYQGQKDSTNQGEDDQVHTYVIFDFFEENRHASGMRLNVLGSIEIVTFIHALEIKLLTCIAPDLLQLLEDSGHMLSTNYYPKVEYSATLRLTEHPDISLFTCFPFGIDSDFKYQLNNGEWQQLKNPNQIIIFSGYLLESLTSIKVLNHKVESKQTDQERFSFAYFSIPKPNTTLVIGNKKVTSEEYFTRYLSLFD